MPVALAAMPVFEDEAGDAEGIQPRGDVVSFVSQGQAAVAPARTDDHRGPVGLGRVGQPDGQRRLVGRLIPLGPRGAVRPEQLGRRRSGRRGAGGGAKNDDKRQEANRRENSQRIMVSSSHEFRRLDPSQNGGPAKERPRWSPSRIWADAS